MLRAPPKQQADGALKPSDSWRRWQPIPVVKELAEIVRQHPLGPRWTTIVVIVWPDEIDARYSHFHEMLEHRAPAGLGIHHRQHAPASSGGRGQQLDRPPDLVVGASSFKVDAGEIIPFFGAVATHANACLVLVK